jgi:hypothetical protein
VSNSAWNYYLGTKGFYFSSEQLGTTKITNVNNNWNFDSTYFTLKNSENEFLISDYDIEYTVKCTIQNDASNYSKCVLNGSNSDTFTGIISSSSTCRNNIDETDVSTYREEECETCHGTKAKPGTNAETCKACGGTGTIKQVVSTILGQMQTTKTCPNCNGEGKVIQEKCQECKGKR